MIPSYVFKHRAWTAIKPWMQALIVIGLLAVLPGLINETAGQLLSDDMSSAVMGPAAALMEFSAQTLPEELTQEQAVALLQEANTLSVTFLQALRDFFLDKGWILLLVAGLDALLTPVLSAPLYGALLDAHRKKEVTFAGAMKYLRMGPKALLLSLWTTLRIYAWMLPGMAVMFVGAFIPAIGSVLVWVGFIAALVLGVRAALHYVLAPIALMDQPRLSLNGCIRSSWQVMRCRKMEYFMLQISFVGWELLISLISSLSVNAVMMAICLTLTMMGQLLLTIYVSGTVTAFWEEYNVNKTIQPGAAEDEPQAGEAGEDLN